MDQPASRPSPAIAVLLALRFLLELALLAAYVVACVRLVGGWAGWAVGLALALLVAAVWGIFLAPRRRIDLPLAVRMLLELVLFAAAAVLLVVSGLTTAGYALLVGELVVIGLLQGPDKHAL